MAVIISHFVAFEYVKLINFFNSGTKKQMVPH